MFTFATTMGNLRKALDIAASERHSFINTFHKRCKMEADDRRRGVHARRNFVGSMLADMRADFQAGSRAFRRFAHATARPFEPRAMTFGSGAATSGEEHRKPKRT